jgi:hypothetical protein
LKVFAEVKWLEGVGKARSGSVRLLYFSAVLSWSARWPEHLLRRRLPDRRSRHVAITVGLYGRGYGAGSRPVVPGCVIFTLVSL